MRNAVYFTSGILNFLILIYFTQVNSASPGIGFKSRARRQEFQYDHDDFFTGESPAAAAAAQFHDSSGPGTAPDIGHTGGSGPGPEHGRGGCEESRCGSNIRHCPHGCHFNSYLCGGRGASYDECCC